MCEKMRWESQSSEQSKMGQWMNKYLASSLRLEAPEPAMNSGSRECQQEASRDCSSASFRRRRGSFVSSSIQHQKRLFCILLLLQSSFLLSVHCDSPPRITIQPNDLIAIEGESTELNCDAEGQPEPSIEWFHNGQPIKGSSHSRTTMSGSIQFLDIRAPSGEGGAPSDTGVYHCLARNALGQARSRNASLQVAYIKPEFLASPVDKLVAVGETVSFECLPQAWPEPRIQWRRNGRLIGANEMHSGSDAHQPDGRLEINRIARTTAAHSSRESIMALESGGSNGSSYNQLIDLIGSQLVIRRVRKSDEGKYSCLVETRGTHRTIELQSSSGQLQALTKPYFIEAPENKSLEAGGQVRLRCRMAGDPEPVIMWRKLSGQPLSEKVQIDPTDNTLFIDKLSVADQGTYVCEGQNSIGSAKAQANVFVNSRPTFTHQPEDQEVNPGDQVRFKCSGDANPPPIMFWYKEGHRQLMFVPKVNAQLLHNPASLGWPQMSPLLAPSLRNSPFSPSSLPVTSDTSPSINKLFSMTLNDYPYSQSYTSSYGGSRVFVDDQGALNIFNVSTSDNGYYACALISPIGSILTKAKLRVRQTPANQDYFDTSSLASPQQSRMSNPLANAGTSKFDLLPPPVIKLGATNQTLPIGTMATLVCDVVSLVRFKIQWLFDGQPLQEDGSRVMVNPETGALSIYDLRPSDTGVYTCRLTAANDQDQPLAAPFEPLDPSMLTSAPPLQQSTSHSAILKVDNPRNPSIQFYRMDNFAFPSSPGPANVVSTKGNDAITIVWAAPSDSGTLPIKEYIVEHYDTSQEHLGWTVIFIVKGKESLEIDGLPADGSHFFVIRAANSHGVGPSSPIAGPFRTVAGEANYQELQRRNSAMDPNRLFSDLNNPAFLQRNLAREKLMTMTTTLRSLVPISSTSLQLMWSTQFNNNASTGDSSDSMDSSEMDDFLDGFSIRYRAVGLGDNFLLRSDQPSNDWNIWPTKPSNVLSPLPLVTSFLDDVEQNPRLRRRDINEYSDYYSQEFKEVRVGRHNSKPIIVNELRQFTVYQFFVVPYYRDIDGVPSNILTSQTYEDRPSVAPSKIIARPINDTAIRLQWFEVPKIHANGVLRGYIVQINQTDVATGDYLQPNQYMQDNPKLLQLPIGILEVNYIEPKSQINMFQQYSLSYDITNLTHKSFYSIQIAASTTVGPGPFSEPYNFIMDRKILADSKITGNDFEDILSKSLILDTHQTSFQNNARIYLLISTVLALIIIVLILGYLIYQRNNQKVTTWKKTISEHFTNKFYMPSTVDHQTTNSMQQNIYDHQQHLIYSNGAPVTQQSLSGHTLWNSNANCINSSETGSLSSRGGVGGNLISNDPGNLNRRLTSEQVPLMNGTKDVEQRFPTQGQFISEETLGGGGGGGVGRALNQQPGMQQIIHHGSDYYSVINNMSVYEELDTQSRGGIGGANGSNNMHSIISAEQIHNTGSNSDTSCPSSVTRLLPNQSYNRELLNRNLTQDLRQEMILQQQMNSTDGKQSFATMMSEPAAAAAAAAANGGGSGRLHAALPLSPYATTNLLSQGLSAAGPRQMSLTNQSVGQVGVNTRGGQNFTIHNSADLSSARMDSSKTFINHQQINGMHNPMSVFKTLQRNSVDVPMRNQAFVPAQQPQMFLPPNSARPLLTEKRTSLL